MSWTYHNLLLPYVQADALALVLTHIVKQDCSWWMQLFVSCETKELTAHDIYTSIASWTDTSLFPGRCTKCSLFQINRFWSIFFFFLFLLVYKFQMYFFLFFSFFFFLFCHIKSKSFQANSGFISTNPAARCDPLQIDFFFLALSHPFSCWYRLSRASNSFAPWGKKEKLTFWFIFYLFVLFIYIFLFIYFLFCCCCFVFFFPMKNFI